MLMPHHLLRSRIFRRRLAYVGLGLAAMAGGAACQPTPQVLTAAPGDVAVTVTVDGQPVDANLSLMNGGQFETRQTGPDGVVVVSLDPGTWTVSGFAQGEPLANDPLCFHTLESNPDPQVTVTSEQTVELEIELEVGGVLCA